ncbi:NACHT, LRR and PYD domains-containing protein 3-like [Pristis pectinata]|uniref:NACHT, LRR and PYD domains-containing protein 3-like n=1 Tax=Pristis pectinata TaxID=685728 RepID=UPI00223DA910|nr:NACHT, LRR and PYD domains-containing protein 3-like [Pristis pectinata]XP_051865189.1 NACHT, LRR and PYD domains-containing protein 3-like [Pristis pectinata]
MAEGADRGADPVTTKRKKKKGGTFTWVQNVFKRFFPGKGDELTSCLSSDQRPVESVVPVECDLSAVRREQSQSGGSPERDGDEVPQADPREAIHSLRGSLNKELSSFDQVTDPKSSLSELLTQWDNSQLFQLGKFYQDRLTEAIEERVEGLSQLLRYEGHFSGPEHEKVTELVGNGNRTEGSKLFLSLVTGKGSATRRVMWESFVKMRKELPKLGRILKEIQDLGPDPHQHMNIAQGSSELPAELKDVQQKHKEILRAQTETLRVNTILMREKVKVFQLVDRYAELTVISTVRGRRLVEHELLARGRDHERWREEHLRGELEKIRTDQLFGSSFSRSKSKSGSSAVVTGVAGIGKTTMVEKIVSDWATGKIYQQFQFVFRFKFRDLNTINCTINLWNLVILFYPYLGKVLERLWKIPERLLFTFDGLDEFKDRIDFADSRRDTEPQHMCTDPEFRCKVSDIVYSLIQHKLLPGCSVLVTTRPTALHLLEKAEISVCAEILGFVGEERKEYFNRFFEGQAVAAAVFKHVEENEILYTMSYNPSYCCVLGLALGPFFTQSQRDPQRVPKTITQLYSYYIYNILKNHSREIESPRDVLLRVGQMAFTGVSERKIVFTDGDLIEYNLQPSQFLSGFLMELLEREDCARSVVYTFPHLTIQEFVAALAQFLTPDPGDILKLLTDAHSKEDGRFEIFLRFVAGLSSPGSARVLEDFLGPFSHQTTCGVIDWVKEEVKRQIGNTESEDGEWTEMEAQKSRLLHILHYLFESQNPGLAQATLGSVETLSFRTLRLTPIDCAVLSNVIRLCETIKLLDLSGCYIQSEGLERLGPGLHKCQGLRLEGISITDSGAEDLTSALSTNSSLTELDLGYNELEDSGVKLVSAVLMDLEWKIQKLQLGNNSLIDSGAEDLSSVRSTIRSLTELDMGYNELGDSGVKLMSQALRDPECKIQSLWLGSVGLTDSGIEDIISALSTNRSLTELDLSYNSLTDRSIPALRHLILTLPSLEQIELRGNEFSRTGDKELRSLQEPRPELTMIL